MQPDALDAAVNATKVRCCISLAAILVVGISPAAGKPNTPVCVSTTEVTVRVSIFETKSRQVLRDKSGVAVWLEPMDRAPKPRAGTPQPHYRMMQHNKMFEPHLLVVPAGSVVEFPNQDPWFHSAFSISNSRFDLGLYGTGVRKSVRFDRAGASYVFCRIHPEMAAVVLAVDSSYFGISDHAGRVSISNVPPGKYLLHVWYENARGKTLDALQSSVVVRNEKNTSPAISVAVTKESPSGHSD